MLEPSAVALLPVFVPQQSHISFGGMARMASVHVGQHECQVLHAVQVPASPLVGYRYLGIMLQPDGGWGAMTAVVIGKVRAWATQVARARLPIDQATMVLKSVVGGLLNYVLSAAPLAAATMTSIDKMVAAALYKCAGLARGRRTAWAFMPVTEGGFGAASAVIMRRSIVLETVLTWLNGQEPPTP